jgi:putative RNA 2'-phosphotransferase
MATSAPFNVPPDRAICDARGMADISRFLSLVLRHKPETIGIALDPQGWVEVDVLLDALRAHGREVTRAELERVVATSDKKRFTVEGTRIRANQGHSVDVDLGLQPETPPARLYHGTVARFVESIRREGLVRGQRHHVHLSADVATARQVGGRRGAPVVLEVDAAAMVRAGHVFYRSANGVWLTDHVPPAFLLE